MHPRHSDTGSSNRTVRADEPFDPDMHADLLVWRCPECAHWAGSSYLCAPESNPAWRPRCKMKDNFCSRPLMEPVYVKIVHFGGANA